MRADTKDGHSHLIPSTTTMVFHGASFVTLLSILYSHSSVAMMSTHSYSLDVSTLMLPVVR